MEVMEVMEKVKAGSNLPEEVVEAKRAESSQKSGEMKLQLSSGSFSTYYTWRGFGTVKLNCGNSAIRANSRVFASISEYNTDPTQNRFIGDAFMVIYNIAPYNGGVIVRLNVGFSSALNVRVDVLVDP
jgi:hypothetical protein